MAHRNEMVWTISKDVVENEYIPVRQARRITRADNSFESRIKCQEECDKRNIRYVRPTPLQLIPDKSN